jgi:hypothetical protein
MKNNNFAVIFSTLITLSSSAHALELQVVKNYKEAASVDIWKRAKTDQVPQALLGNVSTSRPTSSYSTLFPKTFFQEPLFAVCQKNCNDADPFRLRDGEIDQRDKNNWDMIEQSNVYFWLTKFLSFTEQQLNFRPERFLKVLTNREVRDEIKGRKIKNNAFFNPQDTSLSFLPASKNIFFKLLGGKINRSGFDPSVVIHETSHFIFDHLFPNPINDEIGGLNEGFADYYANIFLNEPKIGLVMMQGQAMRDSSQSVDKAGKMKVYEPKMEVHDLGERITFSLWQSRELSRDKEEMDRLVMDAVIDLRNNPYSTIHDFKLKMLERLPFVIDSHQMRNVQTIWDTTIPGEAVKISNFDFLSKPRSGMSLGFSTTQILPENVAQDYGVKTVEKKNFTILQIEKISDSQSAILMSTDENQGSRFFWVAIDDSRNNVLGIFDEKKQLIQDEKELKDIKFLADNAKGAVEIINDFTTKVKAFNELLQGKGEFNLVYKVKDQILSPRELTFNGSSVSGNVLSLSLKRRLLTGVLFGMPDIESVDLYLLANTDLVLPDIKGEKIIGYKIKFRTGTSTEVILNRYSKDEPKL